jgi:Ca2+-transporting ATPase
VHGLRQRSDWGFAQDLRRLPRTCVAHVVHVEGVMPVAAPGLTAAKAARLLAEGGPNTFERPDRWRRVRAVVEALADPMALMLLIAGLVYFAVGEITDAVILLVALIPVLGVDVVLAARSRRALAALSAAVAPTAHVVRDGETIQVAIETIVPGDALVVGEGEVVHADALVARDDNLIVDESHLTGESEPQHRRVGDKVHAGSRVIGGRGVAVVTATGPRTELGRIATLVATAEAGSSPLQHAVRRLVRGLGIAALALAVLLFVLRLVAGSAPMAAFLSAISLAMAAIPEEFPLVLTLFLSLGAVRLARSGVLVRRLAAVEALGATTVICLDKTGTLTRGVFDLDEHRALRGADAELLGAATLACEPAPDDALELAIVAHAATHGVNAAELHARWQLVADHAFERVGKHMTHVWRDAAGWKVVMKGALEGVLEHCDAIAEERAAADRAMAEMARSGLRVLAVAERIGTGEPPRDRDSAERGLRLLGLLGFRDPLRPEVPEAIAACRKAGIAIKVITGDHALTARTIAELAGIAVDDVVTGAELDALPAGERAQRIRWASVLARVRPEQKYEIVDELLRAGEVVAMTGDGINDAPALRRASIGVSMGRGATEVAREAAGLVLLDSNFAALVRTIGEGRRIYANLQRAFLFLVAFHLPIIGLAIAAPALGLPLLLLPVHLVWLELIIHPVAALVFEAEPAPAGMMEQPPRPPRGQILPRRLLARSLASGTIVTLSALAVYVLELDRGVEVARGAALTVVIAGGLALAWAERALDLPWRELRVPRTARFWVVMTLAAFTLPLALLVPPLGEVLQVGPGRPETSILALVLAVVSVAWRAGGARR